MICATNGLPWLKASSIILHDSFFFMRCFESLAPRNDIIFNDAAPNLQMCFSMVRQNIALWLRLDSSSSELNTENIQ